MNSIFGTKHLIILAICAVIIALGYYFARKWDLDRLTRVLFAVGIVSELIKVFYYITVNEEIEYQFYVRRRSADGRSAMAQ